VNVELELLGNDVTIPADIENTDTTLSMEVESGDTSLDVSVNEVDENIDISPNELDEELGIEHEKVIVIEAEAGGYYTPNAKQIDDGTVRISFTPSKGSMLPVAPTDLTVLRGEKGEQGEQGLPGNDGYTPIKGVDYFDGEDGKNGVDGIDGVSVTHEWSGTTLTITSASGSSSSDLKGEKGEKGDKGDKGDTGSTPTLSELANLMLPVGSIYCRNTNVSPADLFGGTWELVDKEFRSEAKSSTEIFSTTTTAVTTGTHYYAIGGHSLRFRVSINYAGTLSATNLMMGTINLNAMGASALGFPITDAVVFSDNSSVGVAYTISNTTSTLGQVTFRNKFGTGTGTSHNFYIDHTIVLNKDRMLDEFCDKFYWKRTA
jgi:hypothetical protein